MVRKLGRSLRSLVSFWNASTLIARPVEVANNNFFLWLVGFDWWSLLSIDLWDCIELIISWDWFKLCMKCRNITDWCGWLRCYSRWLFRRYRSARLGWNEGRAKCYCAPRWGHTFFRAGHNWVFTSASWCCWWNLIRYRFSLFWFRGFRFIWRLRYLL